MVVSLALILATVPASALSGAAGYGAPAVVARQFGPDEASLRRIREHLAPKLELKRLPTVATPQETPPTGDETRQIEALVAEMPNLSVGEEALNACFEGVPWDWSIFDYINDGKAMAGGRELKWARPIVELVKLGPKAIGVLLKHLDDRTPTRITLKLIGGIIGAANLNPVLDVNTADPIEKPHQRDFDIWMLPLDASDGIETYRVRVGDVCFVTLGQIVGRYYFTVRYVPTGCLIISSPVECPKLAKAVREIWTTEAFTRRLLESLIRSYCTQPVKQGIKPDEASDARYAAERFNAAAARRLLYYFPDQAKALGVQAPKR